MKVSKIVLLTTILLLLTIFFIFFPADILNLSVIKSQQAMLHHWVSEQPLLAGSLFFLLYVLVTAFSLPGAVLMTLLSGALFGLAGGTLLVSFASTLGATLALLSSRFLLRDWVQNRFTRHWHTIENGIQREGAFYLFALRLVPLFPFFLINLAMGLTRLPVRTFWWVSQLGMIPGTLVYVNAGQQLGQLESLSGILTPRIIGAFVLLAVLPLISKKILRWLAARKIYAGWKKPRHFDRNLIVIGAGSGGLVTAYIAAAVKANVTLIEKHQMGGDCLNTGCIPSKTLIHSAKMAHALRNSSHLGINNPNVDVDFAAVMNRVQRVISEVEPHDSVERYTRLGVEVIQGEARITSPWTVEVNGQTLSARTLVIASGARPIIPDIAGLDQVSPLTSDTVWTLREKPQRLLVMGGGPIGCELAQAFQRLGCQVTLLERGDRILKREDREASDLVMQNMQAEGVDLRLRHQAVCFAQTAEGKYQLTCINLADNTERVIGFDRVLLALGRTANVSGFGLEALSLPLRKDGTLQTNQYLATVYPNIFAVGDVTGPYQFTHAAAHQAWYAAVNGLFGHLKLFKVDNRLMPRVTFTDPEIAAVGINEDTAQQQGVAYEVTRFPLTTFDRALTDAANQGYIKVLTEPGRDRILGATVVGHCAGELITDYVTASKYRHGLNKILSTIHAYPTWSEANKYAAGEWKKAHTPQWLLKQLQRLHRWRLHS